MSEEAVNGFIVEVRELIDYYRKEWSMNYAELIGTLRILAREAEDELMDDNDDNVDADFGKLVEDEG